MKTDENTTIGIALWEIANDLRGSMNADDFRDYMLSFLFLRYLSDNYEKVAKEELGADYPLNDRNSQLEVARESALGLWYAANSADVDAFESMMRQKLHYVIHPEYLWSNIIELARVEGEKLLTTLEEAFKHIENDSFESSFQGLFSEINLSSEKLGKDYKSRNQKLSTIITQINNGISQFSTDSDTLGDAYEFLIGKFAAGAGQKAGEFYTPQPISSILSGIVTLDAQDPTNGQKHHLERVLDMACGSGSLLLNVRHKMVENGGKIGRIYGGEKNITTYNLARMNMLLHGVKDSEFEIHHGDTLLNDWPLLSEPNPAKKITFDAIVANPPFSLRWQPTEALEQDFRFNGYGLAPKSAADFAFLLHGFHFLDNEGTMAIVLPHGVLFRGGVEDRIRRKLLADGHIDAVIGLPSNLFYSTGIPVCILVLKKCRNNAGDVLFINAKEHYAKERRQNRLREGKDGEPNDIEKIIETYKHRKEEPLYSRCVSMEEIESNDYNLNISRYVSTDEEDAPIDIAEVQRELVEISKRAKAALAEHNAFLRELGLDELPE